MPTHIGDKWFEHKRARLIELVDAYLERRA